jgi:nickel superoxide dismutase
MKKIIILAVFAFLAFVSRSEISAHCEIPCGIYDDHMRVHMIEEHCTTIEKGMDEVIRLTYSAQEVGPASQDVNQLMRWIMNKEHHADQVQEIVSQYFLTQRIKPDAENYHKQLELLHGILLSAMKAKQTTDKAHVEKIRSLLAEFVKLYFKE